jgi:tetratricopeptide (TPR) repeat protein
MTRREPGDDIRAFLRRMAEEIMPVSSAIPPELLERVRRAAEDLRQRLRYTLEEAEWELADGSFVEARQMAERVRAEAEAHDLAWIGEWASWVIAGALCRESLSGAFEAYRSLLRSPDPRRSNRIRATSAGPREGLPERFRRLRKERGFTAAALAGSRYSVTYVSQIERGVRRPSRMALDYFAQRLGVSLEYLETGVPDDLRLRFELERAETDLSKGSFRDAGQRAERVLAGSVESSVRQWASSVLADALFREGRIVEAREMYERLLEDPALTGSHRARATAGLGRASRAVGDLEDAALVVESFLEAEHDPPLDHAGVADLRSVLVSVYFERGDVIRALDAAEGVLDAFSETIPLRTRAVASHPAARVLIERGRLEAALSLMHEARMLVETLRRMGTHETAGAFLHLEMNPPRVGESLLYLDCAERLLRYVEAGGDLASVWIERGRAAYLSGSYDEAAEWAESAAATEGISASEKVRALRVRARALEALDRLEEAAKARREALRILAEDGGDDWAATDALLSGRTVTGPRGVEHEESAHQKITYRTARGPPA